MYTDKQLSNARWLIKIIREINPEEGCSQHIRHLHPAMAKMFPDLFDEYLNSSLRLDEFLELKVIDYIPPKLTEKGFCDLYLHKTKSKQDLINLYEKYWNKRDRYTLADILNLAMLLVEQSQKHNHKYFE